MPPNIKTVTKPIDTAEKLPVLIFGLTQIGRKWRNLGGERFLGKPLHDEISLPDSTGRMQRFENGVIYYKPGIGAFEVHGGILKKWESLGYEASSMGYPISDEQDFTEGGRVSLFEHGVIYWWPDTGAIPLSNEVVVRYTGIICFGETDSDQLSNEDEPYVLLTVKAPELDVKGYQSRVYDDVDAGEGRADSIEVFRGRAGGLLINAVMMEHDEDTPDRYLNSLIGSVSAGLQALRDLIRKIPKYGSVLADILPVDDLARTLGGFLNDILDLRDDQLGGHSMVLSAKEMVVLAGGGVNISNGVTWNKESPIFNGEGSTYKCYFTITQQ